jgi:hydroxymethylpyrimidine kinase/phosphomethylpyrimidine kinase
MPRKSIRKKFSCALTIAGSDSGGGAGIQADLKTFAALGVHGVSAITCITAQNPREVRSIQPIDPGIVRDQIEAVFAELPPAAAKTGMLFSAEIIHAVCDVLEDAGVPVVVDPVMISTSGARLLRDDAVEALGDRLLPLAELMTPNLPEAEFLLGRTIRTLDELRTAARDFHAHYGCAALLKGGHLPGAQAIDFFYDGESELMLESERIRGVSTHGTGCTYSAAITAYRALGQSLPKAVAAAKEYITQAIAASQRCREHDVLNFLWER